MNIEVRPVHAHEIEAVRQLLSDNGWAHRVESAPWFETLIKNSDLAIVALANGAIVGFARAISDQLSNGYVSMVVVAPGYRRQGIGRALMEKLLDQGRGMTWVLRAGRDGAKEFFSSLAFTPSADAMELRR
jgi:ribosomal protein S18 acetylase RimI-like enzyme